jgi:hypothetical protein
LAKSLASKKKKKRHLVVGEATGNKLVRIFLKFEFLNFTFWRNIASQKKNATEQ